MPRYIYISMIVYIPEVNTNIVLRYNIDINIQNLIQYKYFYMKFNTNIFISNWMLIFPYNIQYNVQ